MTRANEPKALLSQQRLERSQLVANAAMNRQRNLTGINSYARELRFDPLRWLAERIDTHRSAAWLDLCCGMGNALLQAADHFRQNSQEQAVRLVGVDLVDMFLPQAVGFPSLNLVAASLHDWQPRNDFDLITCVHGLHYIGDKLGLIQRAASWLVEDGRLVANYDATSLRDERGAALSPRVTRVLRQQGLEYDARKRILACRGRKILRLPYQFLGADDSAGPNYTGQPAVDSYYRTL